MTPRNQGLAGITATIVLGTMVATTAAANAQTVIGQRNSASVSVDLSVLDQLGTTPTVPQLLQPEELADVIAFFASDASRAISGQEVLADRGYSHS